MEKALKNGHLDTVIVGTYTSMGNLVLSTFQTCICYNLENPFKIPILFI